MRSTALLAVRDQLRRDPAPRHELRPAALRCARRASARVPSQPRRRRRCCSTISASSTRSSPIRRCSRSPTNRPARGAARARAARTRSRSSPRARRPARDRMALRRQPCTAKRRSRASPTTCSQRCATCSPPRTPRTARTSHRRISRWRGSTQRRSIATRRRAIRELEDVYPLTPMQRLFFAMETSARAASASSNGSSASTARSTRALLRRAIEHVGRAPQHPAHGVRRRRRRRAAAGRAASRAAAVVRGGLARLARPPSSPHASTDLLRVGRRARLRSGAPPLMRVALRRTGDASWHLVWSTHHLCIDGWSWPVVFRDVSRAYAASRGGQRARARSRDAVPRLCRLARAPRRASEAFWKRAARAVSADADAAASSPAAPRLRCERRTTHFAETSSSTPAAATAALRKLARASAGHAERRS